MKRESKCYAQKGWLPGLINYVFYAAIFFIFTIGVSLIFEQNSYAQISDGIASSVQIKEGDEWRYFKGAQKPPQNWNQIGFDESEWQKGRSGFGYGQSLNNTYLGDMKGNYSTIYARRTFVINNIYEVTGMTLSLVCDGAFIAYLNDLEIIRNNSSRQAERFNVSGFIHELLPGKNILSVECTNDDINSKDYSFIPLFEVHEYQEGGIQ